MRVRVSSPSRQGGDVGGRQQSYGSDFRHQQHIQHASPAPTRPLLTPRPTPLPPLVAPLGSNDQPMFPDARQHQPFHQPHPQGMTVPKSADAAGGVGQSYDQHQHQQQAVPISQRPQHLQSGNEWSSSSHSGPLIQRQNGNGGPGGSGSQWSLPPPQRGPMPNQMASPASASYASSQQADAQRWTGPDYRQPYDNSEPPQRQSLSQSSRDGHNSSRDEFSYQKEERRPRRRYNEHLDYDDEKYYPSPGNAGKSSYCAEPPLRHPQKTISPRRRIRDEEQEYRDEYAVRSRPTSISPRLLVRDGGPEYRNEYDDVAVRDSDSYLLEEDYDGVESRRAFSPPPCPPRRRARSPRRRQLDEGLYSRQQHLGSYENDDPIYYGGDRRSARRNAASDYDEDCVYRRPTSPRRRDYFEDDTRVVLSPSGGSDASNRSSASYRRKPLSPRRRRRYFDKEYDGGREITYSPSIESDVSNRSVRGLPVRTSRFMSSPREHESDLYEVEYTKSRHRPRIRRRPSPLFEEEDDSYEVEVNYPSILRQGRQRPAVDFGGRRVTWSPSTEFPDEDSYASQRSVGSSNRSIAHESIAHGVVTSFALPSRKNITGVIREESEARQQILTEMRQAQEMRDSARDISDVRFWERQIRTLNAALRKLRSHEGYDDDDATSLVSVESTKTISVVAPANLNEGQHLTLRRGGETIIAAVPQGGVRAGETFTVCARR